MNLQSITTWPQTCSGPPSVYWDCNQPAFSVFSCQDSPDRLLSLCAILHAWCSHSCGVTLRAFTLMPCHLAAQTLSGIAACFPSSSTSTLHWPVILGLCRLDPSSCPWRTTAWWTSQIEVLWATAAFSWSKSPQMPSMLRDLISVIPLVHGKTEHRSQPRCIGSVQN